MAELGGIQDWRQWGEGGEMGGKVKRDDINHHVVGAKNHAISHVPSDFKLT
jgi:hypothetical protein